MFIIKIFVIIIAVVFSTDCNSNKKRKAFYMKNSTNNDLTIVLINPWNTNTNCKISRLPNSSTIKLFLKYTRVMLVQFPNNEVLAYYIGVFTGISDPMFISKNSIVNLIFLDDKKIYVKSINEDQDITIQPDEGEGFDLPLMNGSKNEMIDFDITKKSNLKLNLDFPDLDYRNYNLNEDDSMILKACFSVFDREYSKG